VRALPVWALVGLLAACGVAGCGGDDGDDPPSPRPPETIDPLPKLPAGWSQTVNGSGGFAIGVPPGWAAKAAAARTTLRAPGNLVVVSATGDRTSDALELPLDDYATQVAEGLAAQGFEQLEVGEPEERKSPYEAAAVTATGIPEGGGAPQTLEVVIVRRPDLAAYPMLIASVAEAPAKERTQAQASVASLRGRPVELGG
jgi:hypothetical protein